MSAIKKVGVGILVIFILLLLLAFWYKWKFSMEKVEGFEVNNKELLDKVLIASQGSEFKMNVVSDLIDALRAEDIYLKVIDVTDLGLIDENRWNVIVILHTWEYNKPQPDASTFIDKTDRPDKLITLATSGDGNVRIKGIDGISSASKMNEVADVVQYILSKVEEKLRTEVI